MWSSRRCCGNIFLFTSWLLESVLTQRCRASYLDSMPQGAKDGKSKSLKNFDGRRAGGMKKLETPVPATKKKRILSHKWKTSKKLSLGARILDLFHAFQLFCLWQAFLMQIPTFSSILRVLSRNYDIKKSFENLTADGLEDSIELGKWSTLLTYAPDLTAAQMEHKQETFIMWWQM